MEERFIKLTITVGPNEIYGAMRTWSDFQERIGELPGILAEMMHVINHKFPNGYKVTKIETGIFEDKP
ncbi:MAG: hypothetical protein KAV87_20905 [Desulfobacteraceae bacterium]|nr:hypothetical protein [Desulfobacteraceae bacterium]